jgi:glycosyltransferase involved in cell wall biosynthesis
MEKIVIWTGPTWEKWLPADVEQGMAGSETWAVYLADEFARRDFDVRVYLDMPDQDGIFTRTERAPRPVRYRHFRHVINDLRREPADYFISSRTVEPFNYQLMAGKKYVMVHDIILKEKQLTPGAAQVDAYACLSRWHQQYVQQFYGLPDEKMFITCNGCAEQYYGAVDSVPKKNQLFFSSSLDRGLLTLIDYCAEIRQAVGGLKLVVAYGLFNFEERVKRLGSDKDKQLLTELKKALASPDIEFVGRISKRELAQKQLESKAWLYPTTWPETFCITAVEAGMAKCPIIATNFAGLAETVGSGGILINGDPATAEFKREFVSAAVKILTDQREWQHWSDQAYRRMQNFTWQKAADSWIEQFGKWGGQRESNP